MDQYILDTGWLLYTLNVYVRYLRSIGDDVKFISGTDEHGVPITIKARDEKRNQKI